jgi:hypothetical protein
MLGLIGESSRASQNVFPISADRQKSLSCFMCPWIVLKYLRVV